MLAILSSLFGCGVSPKSSGPNFESTMEKVIHTGNIHIYYQMPGNMSKLMNFASRYRKETSRTETVDLKNATFILDGWQDSHRVDGAMWDYVGKRNQGVAGDLGSLHFQISINTFDGELEDYILKTYDDYLNGPAGKNTEIRNSSMGQDSSDAELGHWIIQPPEKLNAIKVNDTEYFEWSVNERNSKTYVFYLLPIDAHHYVSFTFYYTTNSLTENEYSAQEKLSQSNIREIMSRVIIKH